jgi:LmbE family N-acetylglucosaminyl deacetylase
MSTLVVFHAHPDDEAIATGGTMAKAAAAGHRVVLVVATRGERGEVADDYLEPGEELWQRRVEETHAAAAVLGASRVEFLGYVDSGMVDTPANDDPACFWQADVEEAARRLADILEDERADILTAYDENGVYGHPDHVQVHRVGVRAAQLAGTPKVYLNTVDKDFMERSFADLIESGAGVPGDLDPNDLNLGVAHELITTTVDVVDYLDVKRKAMAAHGSQISETSFFLAMAPEMFKTAFGQEWYILVGAPAGTLETDVFAGL